MHLSRWQIWLLGWIKLLDALIRIASLGWIVSDLELTVMFRLVRNMLQRQLRREGKS